MLILLMMPCQVHTQWPCLRKHNNLSVNDAVAAVANGSRATIYRSLNSLVLSYIQRLGLGLRSL